MKALIVTCFESNEERVTFIMQAFIEKGYEVKVLTSDFSHFRKERRNNVPINFDVVETKEYKKNLSIERLLSHKKFSKDAFIKIEEYNPDILWVVAPCNSLIKEANNYKRKHMDKKLVIDIIDMWPESLPISNNIKNLLPFRLWKSIRTNNINCADELVSECNFYHDVLSKEYLKDITTIYWAKDTEIKNPVINCSNDKLSLAYIGSINNIIDIELMKVLIKKIDKEVELHIIGDGENKDNMINALKEVCEVIYHGKVYDLKQKEEILSKCHAGLNVYKEGLYIGLTTKCIDYFMFRLPIINNIKGDTYKFVEDNKIGVNVDTDSIIDAKYIIKLREDNKNILDLYRSNFTKEVFINKCKEVIGRLEK